MSLSAFIALRECPCFWPRRQKRYRSISRVLDSESWHYLGSYACTLYFFHASAADTQMLQWDPIITGPLYRENCLFKRSTYSSVNFVVRTKEIAIVLVTGFYCRIALMVVAIVLLPGLSLSPFSSQFLGVNKVRWTLSLVYCLELSSKIGNPLIKGAIFAGKRGKEGERFHWTDRVKCQPHAQIKT